MTFKTFSAALSAVAVLAAAVPASAVPFGNERPDVNATAGTAEKTRVDAGSLFIGKELARSSVEADTQIAVSVFPSSGEVDRSSRGDS